MAQKPRKKKLRHYITPNKYGYSATVAKGNDPSPDGPEKPSWLQQLINRLFSKRKR